MALRANLRRQGDERQGVTNAELLFDLVYVFAVTQLSQYLYKHPSPTGALHAALLLGMMWQIWIYTTWVTNWLDPDRVPVRLMLLLTMMVSLVMSAGLPRAFSDRGLWVGAAYAIMQVGRSLFAVFGLEGDRVLQRNFIRILLWCVVSGALALIGGLAHGPGRVVLWVAAIGFDALGGAVGFYTPGFGRSAVEEWRISAEHFAERCQAFILIALGESIVAIGSTLSGLAAVSGTQAGAFVLTFVGAIALWWVYFARSAEASANALAAADDPGRLGRSAYTWIHPIMVAGIIVTASADERVLQHPTATADGVTAWLALGGTGLYLAGHAAFKATVWRVVPWSRLAAIAALALLGSLATVVSGLTLGICGCLVVVALCVVDWFMLRGEELGTEHTGVGEPT